MISFDGLKTVTFASIITLPIRLPSSFHRMFKSLGNNMQNIQNFPLHKVPQSPAVTPKTSIANDQTQVRTAVLPLGEGTSY